MNAPTTYVTSVDITLAGKIKDDLEAQGFILSTPIYTLFCAKKQGVSCTLYQTGKLTVQGKEMRAFIEFYLEPEILKSFEFTHKSASAHASENLHPHIGIDESGKGDFFGPLCIAGVYADEAGIEKLYSLGVKDSKTLSDGAIMKISKAIQAHVPHHIVKINPRKYNELYEQFKNLNRLLAWGHATAIENLVASTHCHEVIVDQFASEHVVLTALKRKRIEISLTQRHRAEEDVVVAAASILARYTFLHGLQLLSQEYGLTLPKGASAQTIAIGKEFVHMHGKEALPGVCKMHFKTTQEIS
jgi:ribonuclease HIII